MMQNMPKTYTNKKSLNAFTLSFLSSSLLIVVVVEEEAQVIPDSESGCYF